MKHDAFGDRMKEYEKVFTSQKVNREQPMIVRIDGKGFSKFTKDFIKPFDGTIYSAMYRTAEFLLTETNALLAYHQSDEITLIYENSEVSDYMFSGKISKINSVFASMASAKFNNEYQHFYDKLAFFDCRTWNVPDRHEATNVLYWRFSDAVRNSVSSHYRWNGGGAKKMHKMSEMEMILSMDQDYDSPWQLMPNVFKYGTIIKKAPETHVTHLQSKSPDLKFLSHEQRLNLIFEKDHIL